MQKDDVWLNGLIQPGQIEIMIGCLNEQAPMLLLYTLMRLLRSRELGPADMADSHVLPLFQIINHFKNFGESKFFKFDQIYIIK